MHSRLLPSLASPEVPKVFYAVRNGFKPCFRLYCIMPSLWARPFSLRYGQEDGLCEMVGFIRSDGQIWFPSASHATLEFYYLVNGFYIWMNECHVWTDSVFTWVYTQCLSQNGDAAKDRRCEIRLIHNVESSSFKGQHLSLPPRVEKTSQKPSNIYQLGFRQLALFAGPMSRRRYPTVYAVQNSCNTARYYLSRQDRENFWR